ncbi:MAG: hypothetical protein K5647_01430 [Clostridiales bacterium]|nr:hypothetical protein [Clostridiales bacterium]
MSTHRLTSLLVCFAAVLSLAACTGADPEQSTADITSAVSPENTSAQAGNDTDAVDVTSEVTTSADVTTESITTAVEITTADITTDQSAATSAPADTTPEIPADTSTPPETTSPEETTGAETSPDVTGPSVPDPEAEKEAYYRTYYSSGDFGYAGEIKKVHMESSGQTFDFISSGSFFRFSGNESGSYVSVAETDGRFVLAVASVGENGALSAQYYRSEKKEGESFADFTAGLGFEDLGAVNRDDLTASGYKGSAVINGVLYDSVEITATQKITDDNGKETGESFSVPFTVYVQPDTHKIFRFYMIEEYMTIGADGRTETSRELLTIDYLSEYAGDIPAGAVFTDVATSELEEVYQAALLVILLGA